MKGGQRGRRRRLHRTAVQSGSKSTRLHYRHQTVNTSLKNASRWFCALDAAVREGFDADRRNNRCASYSPRLT